MTMKARVLTWVSMTVERTKAQGEIDVFSSSPRDSRKSLVPLVEADWLGLEDCDANNQ
jgi:hypothetical protein